MNRPRLLSSLARAPRYAVVVLGGLGLLTSVELACTFSDEPPKKTSAVTDSGPLPSPGTDASSSSSTTSSSGGTYGYYGYGYGYGPDGCYGYGYGYEPTYSGYPGDCN